MICIGIDKKDFYNADYINRMICDAQDSEVLLYCNEWISQEQLEIGSVDRFVRDEKETVIWSNLEISGECGFDELLQQGLWVPCAYAFSKKMLKETGCLNPGLVSGQHYEFILRMVYETGKCKMIPVPVQYGGEELDYTAGGYVVKKYLKYLHENSLAEKMIQEISRQAIERNQFALFQEQMNLMLNKETVYGEIARKTAPFLVILGDQTCGGVLRDFAEKLAEAFIQCGQAVICIGDDFQEYELLQNRIYKGIVGFQSPALEIEFFQKLQGPKLQFWFDYPLHFQKGLRNLSEDNYLLCQDANYAAVIRDYYHSPNAIQFPPAGVALSECWDDVNQGRPYDIVFIGTYFEEDLGSFSWHEKQYYQFMLNHPGLTFEEGLKEYMGDGLDDLPDAMFGMKKVNRAVLAHFRKKTLDTILEAGFDIHVYGDSWKSYENHGEGRLIIHPQVTPEEALKEWSRARIGLNMMSWHKAGMTERIANIMLSGAVCISEETAYLKEHFVDGQEILTYSLEHLEDLPVMISEILKEEDKRCQMAKNAYEKAVKEHTWIVRAQELLELVNAHSQNSVEIYVATHVKFQPPQNSIYIPLHVGREGKEDLGYLGDNTGNHISDLNYLYGELTGLFWIWQNVEYTDYVGICHYRRYFLNEEGRIMRKAEYLSLLKKYDAVIPVHLEAECPYEEHYGKAHNRRDLEAVERALLRLYPEYHETYRRIMTGTQFYSGNLMVTSLPLLKAYAEWLFQIFVEASEEIDVSTYDAYHRRVYGFLSEQMFYVFLEANHLSYCEVPVGISQEKAETKELIDLLLKYIQEGRIPEAKKVFNTRLLERPDLLLPGSDIRNELQDIYKMLQEK